MQKSLLHWFSLLFLLAIASCKSGYQKAGLTVVDFPAYDSLQFDPLDQPSGKLFDILTDKSTGLTFSNDVGFRMRNDNNQYNYFYNGSGVAILDVNRDQLPDIYFTGNIVHDKLFLNLGNLKFRDITEEAGIATRHKGWSTGVCITDINNDGYDDIYVCRSRWKDTSANLLYVNNGNGTFTERAKEYGLDVPGSYSIMANFFDYDKDGDLDMFLANHPTDWIEKLRFNNLEKIEQGINQTSMLFRNDKGSFVNVSKQAGINTHAYSLSATVGDFNQDTWPDIYVGNDFAMYDYLFINQRNGTFKEMAREILRKTPLFGMGSEVSDINNDGFLDIMCVDMKFDKSYMRRSFMLAQRRNEFHNMVSSGYHYQYVRNMLQLNNGNGTFSEIGCLAGVDATEWSWSPLFVDFDNDGFEDLFVSNGYYKTFNIDERELVQGLRDATRRGDTAAFNRIAAIINNRKLRDPNIIFRNNGDLTFSNKTYEWGFFQPTITHGAAFADFDNDGDMDIITSNTEQPPYLYRNNAAQKTGNYYIRFVLQGPPANRQAIGAEVTVYTENGIRFQSHHIVRGYQATSQNVLHFGLGTLNKIEKVVVLWPDGKVSEHTGLAVNQTHSLSYQDAISKSLPKQSVDLLFTDLTAKLGIDFQHQENLYDDFRKELLLPQKNSQFGPGVAVGDVNGDGLEDFVVGGALRQSSALYLQNANGTFAHKSDMKFPAGADVLGCLLFDADGDGDLDLYLATGGNELGVDDSRYRDYFFLNDGKGNFTDASDRIPGPALSNSCVTAGDYDADGDLDLFVGGRVKPQHYPFAVPSLILRNDAGRFTDVTADVAPELQQAGLVTSALWSDFNNDGRLDLIYTGEWMNIRFLQNEGARFKNVTDATGLANYFGWWNSIVGADFDHDGDTDYIVGNEGLNTRFYCPTDKEPVYLHAHDFDQNGTNDIILSFYNQGKLYPTKNLQYSAEQMPILTKEFKTYSGFALSTTEEIYGPKGLDKAYVLKANTLSSSYVENLGNGRFSLRALPLRAQVSCIYGMLPYDVNNDGHLDLIYHGNFYAKETETERNDAFVGEVLLGDGKGNFTYLPSRLSGFRSDKDARGLAIIHIGRNQQPVVLGTNNNSGMFAFGLNKATLRKVPFAPGDRFAEVITAHGDRQRIEWYIGNGYLSQNSSLFAVPANAEQVVITDAQGKQRTVVQRSAAVASR